MKERGSSHGRRLARGGVERYLAVLAAQDSKQRVHGVGIGLERGRVVFLLVVDDGLIGGGGESRFEKTGQLWQTPSDTQADRPEEMEALVGLRKSLDTEPCRWRKFGGEGKEGGGVLRRLSPKLNRLNAVPLPL